MSSISRSAENSSGSTPKETRPGCRMFTLTMFDNAANFELGGIRKLNGFGRMVNIHKSNNNCEPCALDFAQRVIILRAKEAQSDVKETAWHPGARDD